MLEIEEYKLSASFAANCDDMMNYLPKPLGDCEGWEYDSIKPIGPSYGILGDDYLIGDDKNNCICTYTSGGDNLTTS